MSDRMSSGRESEAGEGQVNKKEENKARRDG